MGYDSQFRMETHLTFRTTTLTFHLLAAVRPSSGFKSACKQDRTTLSALWPNSKVFFEALKGIEGKCGRTFTAFGGWVLDDLADVFGAGFGCPMVKGFAGIVLMRAMGNCSLTD